MHNDKNEIILVERLNKEESELSVDTRITIKYSEIFPLDGKLKEFLGRACLMARQVLRTCLESSGDVKIEPWMYEVLETHLGYNRHGKTTNRDALELTLRAMKRLGQVKVGLDGSYSIADLQPRLFTEWVLQHEKAMHTGVLDHLIELGVYNPFMLSQDQHSLAKELRKLFATKDFGDFGNFFTKSDKDYMLIKYQQFFKEYVENSNVRGRVTIRTWKYPEVQDGDKKPSPKEAQELPFDKWKKAPQLKGYRKAMIKAAGSIALHFGKMQKLVGLGDTGLKSAVHTLIHEATHKFAGTLDYAYIHDAGYKTLSMAQAVNNADSLAWTAMSFYMKKCLYEHDSVLARNS
jgi:hypothetical protein